MSIDKILIYNISKFDKEQSKSSNANIIGEKAGLLLFSFVVNARECIPEP